MFKTLEESEAAARAARARFEANTVAFEAAGEPVTMADARAVFERYHPGDDWKRPVDARGVPYADVEKFALACQFYHGGSRPKVVAEASGSGAERGYRVTSPGYVC